jgi:tRNA threonylcarbamoyladenosine biosynthesis protein TsaB
MANSERQIVSIAIETSCRYGGVALGIGQRLIREIAFDASSRHATALVVQLKELLSGQALTPGDVDELYVSCGPGSFTGVRVGVTVARTLAQVRPGLRCVAVHTPAAVAHGARGLPWQRLAVVLDAREDMVHVTRFVRQGEGVVQEGPSQVLTDARPDDICPPPATLIGEGLLYHRIEAAGLMIAPPELYMPTAGNVWAVGRAMAAAGEFTEHHRLLPVYARAPEAVRLWEQRQAAAQAAGPQDAASERPNKV